MLVVTVALSDPATVDLEAVKAAELPHGHGAPGYGAQCLSAVPRTVRV